MTNRRKVHPLFLSLLILVSAPPMHATTYCVGPTRKAATFEAVLPRLRAGDVVELDPGIYRETAKLGVIGTREAPVIIRGVGSGRAVFDADGLDTSGRGPVPRGALQIEGAYIVLEHLEFRNARNGENAAGIRLLASTNVVIRDCKVSRCDMGIFGGDRETALIENCEVCGNGTGKFNGFSHNFYMDGNRVVVSGCFIHDALFGQNYKSRAHYNELWFNWITNSNEGEVGCVDSAGQTDRPQSNTLLVGNTILSRPDRTGNTSKFVLFGSELGAGHDGTLFAFHNTFIAGDNRIKFVTLADPQASAVIRNNVFVGSGQILNPAQPPLSVVFEHNLSPADNHFSELEEKQPAAALHYIDGDGVSHPLDLIRFRPGYQLPGK